MQCEIKTSTNGEFKNYIYLVFKTENQAEEIADLFTAKGYEYESMVCFDGFFNAIRLKKPIKNSILIPMKYFIKIRDILKIIHSKYPIWSALHEVDTLIEDISDVNFSDKREEK